MKKNRMGAFTLAVLAIAGIASTAEAGMATGPKNVQITYGTDGAVSGAGTAEGSLGTARNSADQNQFIGCKVTADKHQRSLSCTAADSSGARFASCGSSDTRLLSIAVAIHADSWISFSWDASGTCTKLEVDNTSYYESGVNVCR